MPSLLRTITPLLALISTGLATTPAPEVSHRDGPMDKVYAADRAFFDSYQKTQVDYRHNIAELLRTTDPKLLSVEIFLLDFDLQETPDFISPFGGEADAEYFSIAAYRKNARVLKKRKLNREEWLSLRDSLAQVVGTKNTEGGAFCHFPIHGIKIRLGYLDREGNLVEGRDLLENSFCYECANFSQTYPIGGGFVGIENGEAFQKIMERLMPIPEAEIQRFKKKMKK